MEVGTLPQIREFWRARDAATKASEIKLHGGVYESRQNASSLFSPQTDNIVPWARRCHTTGTKERLHARKVGPRRASLRLSRAWPSKRGNSREKLRGNKVDGRTVERRPAAAAAACVLSQAFFSRRSPCQFVSNDYRKSTKSQFRKGARRGGTLVYWR